MDAATVTESIKKKKSKKTGSKKKVSSKKTSSASSGARKPSAARSAKPTSTKRSGGAAAASVRTAEPEKSSSNTILWVVGAALIIGAIVWATSRGDTATATPETGTSATTAAASATVAATDAPADVAQPPADAKKEASGLVTKVLNKGTGSEHPGVNDTVKVHYTGWTKDGKMFDSSVKRGQPASFGVSKVIPGWTEGLQLMVTGEKRRMWIPGSLAYGDKPARPGSPAGQLTFDVELIEITAAPKVPEDLAAPPEDAKKTDSGLVYKVLAKGSGTTKPSPSDRVEVHYSGWTKDGKMFDSSVVRGRPAQFSVGGVIKGWTEGLQLMVEGEKVRLWIPSDLAYGDNPGRGRPAGELVFDVELIKIIAPTKPDASAAASAAPAPTAAATAPTATAPQPVKTGAPAPPKPPAPPPPPATKPPAPPKPPTPKAPPAKDPYD